MYKNHYAIFTYFIIFCCVIVFGIFTFFREKFSEKNPKEITPAEYVEWLVSLPDTPFRRNMLTVFRAEFEKDSVFLNNLLQSYLEVKEDQEKEKETAKY